MIEIHVFIKFTKEPLKRTPVIVLLDAGDEQIGPILTDRAGVARFDIPNAGSGKILVSGVERYHGRLESVISIPLWSIAESADESTGAPGGYSAGSNAYPDMMTHNLEVDGRDIITDSEGYLVNPDDWSEAFVKVEAAREGLILNAEHWEVIRFLRDYYSSHGHQASVRDMIKHFRGAWDEDRGSNHHLHALFPAGGPQKQGNRLAGLLRTKGEH
jgi:tRNA 2-thiouridine synthesizing protein E